MALVQPRDSSAWGRGCDEVALRAPAAAVYKTHSTSIVYALEDLKGMPEGELADLRKAETSAQHNYDMLEQSLEDQKGAYGKRPGGREEHRSRGC